MKKTLSIDQLGSLPCRAPRSTIYEDGRCLKLFPPGLGVSKKDRALRFTSIVLAGTSIKATLSLVHTRTAS